jgi:Mlc titration factor MtfA (ptsG expression regulator)
VPGFLANLFGITARRRQRLRAQPFPQAWLAILQKNVPYYAKLPEADRKELEGHIQVLAAEKNFEGCGGLLMTEEIQVTIAAQAGILLLHREPHYYPGLYSILVYPHAFVTEGYEELAPGYRLETEQVHLGESWQQGSLILSWDDVRAGAADIHDGHNVVFHEFAHQLDTEDGHADGAPVLPRRSMYIAWARILSREFEKLREDKRRGHHFLLNQYGATNAAEFFAVATEYFFEKPRQMQDKQPELYEELKMFYQQDPVRLLS